MPHSSTKLAPKRPGLREQVSDLLWSEERDRESRWAAAHERAQERLADLAAIEALYDFERSDALSLLKKDGTPVQLAMRLTRKCDPAETFAVVCRVEAEGEMLWFITDVSRAASHPSFDAASFINATQNRIIRNRAAGGRN